MRSRVTDRPPSITELAAALRAKHLSCVELTRATLDRIARVDPQLNAFITVDAERALADAHAADTAIAAGTAGPLAGIPIAHKDILATAGMRTTCGSRMLANYTSPYDAHVVEGLKRAGTVLVGKTNMDEFAMGSSSETSYFGPVKNPGTRLCSRRQLRRHGGSGRRAARAGSTGTDTGGSIRQPAAFSGICGLKPTYGICSRFGLVAFASSLDQAGPFARSAHDLALLLNAMAGHDARDSTSLERADRGLHARLLAMERGAKPLAGIRIGLPARIFRRRIDPGRAGNRRRARRAAHARAPSRSTSRSRTSGSPCPFTT